LRAVRLSSWPPVSDVPAWSCRACPSARRRARPFRGRSSNKAVGEGFSRRLRDTEKHPRRAAGGGVRSAIAILAGAGVAAAAGFGGAAALAILSGSLAVGHSNSPFSRCSKRANHHIASVPWYRVKQPNR
jgi:hypothetical protein